MKKGYTEIAVVLDRSGSMGSIKQDTIGGFNEFVKTQKEVEGEATLTLAQFDTMYEIVHEGLNIKDVPELTDRTYSPRGSTALLDAIGRTINSVGNRLANTDESNRPEKVIFVIITDGEENASREYTRDKVFEMIKHQREVYKWEFVFIGANQDAIQAGTSFGVSAGSSFTFDHSGLGVKSAYTALTNNAVSYRSNTVANMDFTDEQREEQEDLMNTNTVTK